MLTKNNWLHTNLSERFVDKLVEFNIDINPYPFKDMLFQDAADYTCREISKGYECLYLALSGGMDSEFVLRCFNRNGIDIHPIIVVCGNLIENEYAFKVCIELGITPTIIEITEEQFVEFYDEHICKKLNGVGYNSTQALFVAEMVEQLGGTMITGNHFMGDGDSMITDSVYLTSNEWDFYAEYCFEGCNVIDFYLYTPEIVYASMPRELITWNRYKQQILQIEYRNKMKPVYSETTMSKLRMMASNRILPKRTGISWSKDKFFAVFDKYKF